MAESAARSRSVAPERTPGPGAGACACAAAPSSAYACPKCRTRARLSRFGLGAGPQVAPPIVDEVLSNAGAPLDPARRHAMEARLGHDFSRVRVHSGARAEASAGAVNALAYTVGHHIVFASAAPAHDDELLAHELTHVVQQRGLQHEPGAPLPVDDEHSPAEQEARQAASSNRPATPPVARTLAVARLQRQPARRGTAAPREPVLTTVDVDQETPQSVTLTWSDGRTETDTCSTGKGHCCLDESAADGAACTAAGSTAGGSNCTPVGSFLVTAKVPVTAGGVRLWTQFHDARSIALHEYRPVDGTPLSHGCVRLNEDTAQKIYDGAQVQRTRVTVRNLAKPRCNHPALQREWIGDFSSAGSRAPDGDDINPDTGERYSRADIARERRHIRHAREEMRSALGTDEAGLDDLLAGLNAETADLATSTSAERATTTAAVATRIPRCVPTETTEEARLPDATAAGLAGTRARQVRALERALQRSGSQAGARRAVQSAGRALWEQATADARSGAEDSDDRVLYWARLEFARVVRTVEPAWLRPPASNPDRARRARAELLDVLERSSRGMDSAAFDQRGDGDIKRIVVAGFDPFGLEASVERSNPSAAAALALDNELLRGSDGSTARVQAAVFPVRYADFDAGVAESFFRPFLGGRRPAHMIVTISMGSSGDSELEEYAGGRRATRPGVSDNLGIAGGGSLSEPRAIPGAASNAEFLRTNVPDETLGAMRGAVGRTEALPGERDVNEIPAGEDAPRLSPGGPSPGSTAVTGSGGGYLSNEIFYRVLSLQGAEQAADGADSPTTLVVHLHTPLLEAPTEDTRATYARSRHELAAEARRIIESALPTL